MKDDDNRDNRDRRPHIEDFEKTASRVYDTLQDNPPNVLQLLLKADRIRASSAPSQPSAEPAKSPTRGGPKRTASAAELADLLITERFKRRIELEGIDYPGLLTDALNELERGEETK